MSPPVLQFRRSPALTVAGFVALISAIPLATVSWYLAPVLLIPTAILIWAWRSGTDVSTEGLVVRALLGQRRIPWDAVREVSARGRRAQVTLSNGAIVPLPTVGQADLVAITKLTRQRPAAG